MARPRLSEEQKYLRESARQELKRELAIRRNASKLETQQYRELTRLELENKYKQKKILSEEKEKLRAKVTGVPTWAKSLYDKPTGKSATKGFFKQFSQIAKSVPRQTQSAVDVRQIMQQQQIQPQRPQRRNFFEHGSELEVYGDEGLTFFDSQKRSQRSTGSLFGLGD